MTYPVALSELLLDLLTDRLVPMHSEEDEGTLETLRSSGGLAVLDLLLLDWCDLLRQGREG